MSTSVMPVPANRIDAQASTDNVEALAGKKPKESKERIAHLAQEFEGLMLRQLLSHVDLGIKSSGVQASLATEALASGLAQAGGMGLQRQIEAMVHTAQHRAEHGSSAPAPRENSAVNKSDGTF